jgi:hypothetical protein
VPAHCYGEATSTVSTIFPDVLGGLGPSDASETPDNNAGSSFGLEEQVAGEQCSHSQKDQDAVEVRPTFESREPLKSLHSSHDIATERCFEHFRRSQCSFPEFEAKFHANALFFLISHFICNRKSRIALNTHKNKHSLRNNTKGYGGKTH